MSCNNVNNWNSKVLKEQWKTLLTFLKHFDWPDSSLTAEQIVQLKKILIKSHDVFAKKCFDVGYKREVRVKLTLAHDLPVLVQNQYSATYMRDISVVGLSSMQKIGKITILSNPNSKKPSFGQKSASRQLRFLTDFERVHNLLTNDWNRNIFP